ncbi:uncharacterized protein LOC129549265 [Moschus berezovskii]|uniref:uncharacterized protein LOC129549265 n=1 Tax=Moschus berezovskii TaxID=68408 RepID=UPI002443A4B7|nr:uncharacterized protein LOC129549265 [Moschus berezovskii]
MQAHCLPHAPSSPSPRTLQTWDPSQPDPRMILNINEDSGGTGAGAGLQVSRPGVNHRAGWRGRVFACGHKGRIDFDVHTPAPRGGLQQSRKGPWGPQQDSVPGGGCGLVRGRAEQRPGLRRALARPQGRRLRLTSWALRVVCLPSCVTGKRPRRPGTKGSSLMTTTLLGCSADLQSGHPSGHTMKQDTPRPHCDPGHPSSHADTGYPSSHTMTEADWHPELDTETPARWENLTVCCPQDVDPRPDGTRRLVMLTPGCLTIGRMSVR